MRDDEDYKEQEQWKRDSYHLFKLPGSETMFMIPRPFEVGAMGAMAERVVEQMVDDKVHGELLAERLFHTVSDTFAMNPTPQILKPAIEVAMNKSWFTGRAIENMGMEKLSPENRRTAWTSETAIGISEAMGAVIPWDKVVLSPVQIQHLVRGYFGWVGATTLAGTDMLFRAATDSPAKPEKRWTELPVIKAFSQSGPAKNTQYATSFYENLTKLNMAYSDINQAREHHEFEKARELYAENRNILKYRQLYTKTQKQLSALRKQMTQIMINKDTDAETKQLQMDRLMEHKNRLTERVISLTSEDF
jgi:hypothetical protein